MINRLGTARLLALATALLAVACAEGALAAPRAVELGPAAALTAPSGGYVGRLEVTPEHGPAGTLVTVSGEGFTAEQEFELVWRTVEGRWNVTEAEYLGREFTSVGYRIARVRSDRSGHISTSFVAPEDFGFLHDIVVQQGDRLLTQTAFRLDMTVRLAADRGPLGSPIPIEVQGIGWRELEGSWVLLYDNKFTGFISVVTTHGTARFTIPATGHVGAHIIEVLHSDFGSPYRNTQQSPVPDRPQFKLAFTVTAGAPVLPRAPAEQAQTAVRALPAPGELVATPPFSGVGGRVVVSGGGFEPGKDYKLHWRTVVGNRMSGAGWEEQSRVVSEAIADASGRAEFRFHAPDDLGGAHALWAEVGGRRKQGSYWIAPTALPLQLTRGPVGTTFSLHLKGVGWSETANIYTVVYDNAVSGYACAFNSQGDVEIFMQATGEAGWHFIDLYPAIYKGRERRPNNYRLPQLTYADDHPGEDLPRFSFAFEVTETNAVGQ
ncbi:MAG TPA: hypothetical protein VGF60_04365 [Xanthobacteraceae bacterium]